MQFLAPTCQVVEKGVVEVPNINLPVPKLVIGSMPCDPWTMGNHHTRKDKHHIGLADINRGLPTLHCHMAIGSLEGLFGGWMENVKHLLNKNHRADLTTICESLGHFGVGGRLGPKPQASMSGLIGCVGATSGWLDGWAGGWVGKWAVEWVGGLGWNNSWTTAHGSWFIGPTPCELGNASWTQTTASTAPRQQGGA